MNERRVERIPRLLVTGPSEPLLPPRNNFAANWNPGVVGFVAAHPFTARCEVRSLSPHIPKGRGLSLSVSQLILSEGCCRSWKSLIVRCDEDADGTLATRVIVANPAWTELLQIACLRSRPRDRKTFDPLECDLNHKNLFL